MTARVRDGITAPTFNSTAGISSNTKSKSYQKWEFKMGVLHIEEQGRIEGLGTALLLVVVFIAATKPCDHS